MSRVMTRALESSAMAYPVNRRIAERAGLSIRERVHIVVYFLVLFLGALFYIWVQSAVVEASYRLSALREEARALTASQDDLKVEIARLRSPAELSRVAMEELHMVQPEPGQVVFVE